MTARSPLRDLFLLLSIILTAAACHAGKGEGQPCRLSNDLGSDPCANGLSCDTTEACQEGSSTCEGACRPNCSRDAGTCIHGTHCINNDYTAVICRSD